MAGQARTISLYQARVSATELGSFMRFAFVRQGLHDETTTFRLELKAFRSERLLELIPRCGPTDCCLEFHAKTTGTFQQVRGLSSFTLGIAGSLALVAQCDNGGQAHLAAGRGPMAIWRGAALPDSRRSRRFRVASVTAVSHCYCYGVERVPMTARVLPPPAGLPGGALSLGCPEFLGYYNTPCIN